MTEETGDFCRTKFAALQQKNMTATGRIRLTVQNIREEAAAFSEKFPSVLVSVSENGSGMEFEAELSFELKIRLFVQNQVKGSILQKTDAGFVKLGDAKFWTNPFPELEDFVNHFKEYQSELEEWSIGRQKFLKMQKLTGEMIKSILKKKLDGKGLVWFLEPTDSAFILTIETAGQKQTYNLSMSSFVQEINELEI